ncbi:hypothetical protein [Brunnivagina elsteri]|uniref:Uncharacterized protein n=1 Tax=Brunnivagina elsteri CCALA 953 TaxID=987040 RepID=A0A2A2TL39_9CYAN|nr:hypothetical protein [Calothrix elsteri]PAX57933.1 hypothetical protein CK510_08705 [Calothrix elsteri CCALA 953]
MIINCPHCNQIDKVKKISSIYSSGISNAQLSGSFNLNASTQTIISSVFTPPTKPKKPWVSLKAVKKSCFFSSLCVLLSLLGMSLIRAFFYNEFLIGLLAWAFFFSVIAFVATATLISLRLSNKLYDLSDVYIYSGNSYQEHINSWQRACDIWNKIYHCSRCDIVYNPANKKEVYPTLQVDIFWKNFVYINPKLIKFINKVNDYI